MQYNLILVYNTLKITSIILRSILDSERGDKADDLTTVFIYLFYFLQANFRLIVIEEKFWV